MRRTNSTNLYVYVSFLLSTMRRDCEFFQAEVGMRDYKVTGVQTCALPICIKINCLTFMKKPAHVLLVPLLAALLMPDRKSTRLNSSHLVISYAVFCLK